MFSELLRRGIQLVSPLQLEGWGNLVFHSDMHRLSSLPLALVLLVLSLMVHLYEEVRTGFRQAFPLGEMPRLLFLSINILIYLYAAVMIALSLQGHRLAIHMAWIFSLAMLANALGHLGIQLIRRAYFPGGYTAVLLLLTASNVLRLLLGAG